ncbi:MAG: hypothetical protein IPL86_11945 [Flavobacteriales bacterium]|nr:hypothetical protein [Flavobacteriales bacterium]
MPAYGIAPAVIGGDSISTTDLMRRRWLANTLTGSNASAEVKAGRAQTDARAQLLAVQRRTLRRVISRARHAGKHGHPQSLL